MTADHQFLLLLESARAKHVEGKLAEAIPIYEKALKRAPRSADALKLLGVAYFQAGDLKQAERLMRDAIKVAPRDAATLVNLGALYKRRKQLDKAIKSYRDALAVDPRSAEAYFNLGGVYFEQKDHVAAVAAYHAAIEIQPNDPEFHVNLGNAYKYLSRKNPEKWPSAIAVAAYERALQIDPRVPEAYANLASVYRDRTWFFVASAMLDKAIALAPNATKFRTKRAFTLLPTGRLAQGWRDYEYRFFGAEERTPKKAIPPPYWNGEDLNGKTIFVWIEQGLGDQILFSNMLPDLLARGARVHINSMARLKSVFERSFAGVFVGSGKPDDPVPPEKRYDYQIALLSLGQYFRNNFADFPRHRGYLRADPVKVAVFRERYRRLAAGRRIVGVSWRSKNDKFGEAKSAALSEWADILQCPNAWFVNLQYGECVDELREVKQKLGVDIYVDDAVDSMGDLDDFFAQVAALDLVISTSNTTVHVAGAMNIPTWLLLPRGLGSLWYWFMDREDSPWYPSLRIFRNPNAPGSAAPWWRDVVARVGAELGKLPAPQAAADRS